MEAYQGDDGGSGPGARHDVQVVGQVELEQTKGWLTAKFTSKVKVALTVRLEGRPCAMSQSGTLTSLVLQMLPSVDPQALPGVAVHGMIPASVRVETLSARTTQ